MTPVRPKILRLALAKAEDDDGSRSLNAFTTSYVISRTLEAILAALTEALAGGRFNDKAGDRVVGLLRMRDACTEAAGLLLACAEQAERDRDAVVKQERASRARSLASDG